MVNQFKRQGESINAIHHACRVLNGCGPIGVQVCHDLGWHKFQITVGAKLSGQATRFSLELSKGCNDGIAMKAVEANDPVVTHSAVNKDQGIAVSDLTQMITKDNVKVN